MPSPVAELDVVDRVALIENSLVLWGPVAVDVLRSGRRIDNPPERLAYYAEHARALGQLVKTYEEKPVDPMTFVESKKYLDKKGAYYPEVLKCFVELNSGRYDTAVLTGGIGTAKALDLDTVVPTPMGWTTMGQLKTGDIIYGSDGKTCNVVFAHPILIDQDCLEVEFDDGSRVVADAGHLWETWDWGARHRPHIHKARVRTTLDISEKVKHKGITNHAVRIAGPLEGSTRVLRVDPYVLGAWLGDGSSSSGRFWTADNEMITQLRQRCVVEDRRYEQPYRWLLWGIQPHLRALGVLNNKHIPAIYMRASYSQRLDLLRGLMDTDGTVDKGRGRCSFSSTIEKLAISVLELATALGLKATIKESRAKLKGKDCGPYWRVGFMAAGIQPFTLPRKAVLVGRLGSRETCTQWRYITAVRKVPSRPVRCITVDSADQLYLVGKSMVPTHNTTLANLTQAYTLYLLSILKHPQRLYGLLDSDEIIIAMQSKTIGLARTVDYNRFQALISGAPYFRNYFRHDEGLKSEMIFPKRIIVKPASGEVTALVGQNVYSANIDEANEMEVIERSKQARDKDVFDQAHELFRVASTRRESRFMAVGGSVPGVICLISSSKYPGEFTQKIVDQAKAELKETGTTRTYIYNKRIWEVRPEKFVDSHWFRVFLGDDSRQPYIIEPDQKVPLEDKHLVMEIPEEYRKRFRDDILDALRDIAGVSTQALHPFMPNVAKIAKCFGKVKSVLSLPLCDFLDTKPVIRKELVHKPKEPRWVHIDLGLGRKDSVGMSCGFVDRFIEVKFGDAYEILPVIRFDFILEVRAPRGGEVEFENQRQLIYRLSEAGINVRWVSLDSWQSIDTLQILKQRGYITGPQSMDKTVTPYSWTKSAFMDGRVEAPTHAKALSEMTALEFDPKKKKIDHPVHGSKDCADSVAGVVYGLTMRTEVWARHGVQTRLPQRLLQEAKKDPNEEATAKGERTRVRGEYRYVDKQGRILDRGEDG